MAKNVWWTKKIKIQRKEMSTNTMNQLSMVAERGQNSDKINTQYTDVKSNNISNNVAIPETPSCWKSKCIINMMEFFEKPKCYAHIVTEDGLLPNPVKLQKFEKRNCAVLVMDKNLSLHKKHCHKIDDVPVG